MPVIISCLPRNRAPVTVETPLAQASLPTWLPRIWLMTSPSETIPGTRRPATRVHESPTKPVRPDSTGSEPPVT
jgi:hypothetical protein